MTTLKMLPLLAVAVALTTGCADDLLTPGPTEAAAQEAVPASAEPGTRMRGPGWGMRGMLRGEPLARLLEHREALALTAEQIAQLETLSTDLRARREDLRARLQASAGARPARTPGERARLSEEERAALRAEMQARRAALQPLMQVLLETRRGAMAEVLDILTDDQEATLRELRAERSAASRAEPRHRGEGRWRSRPLGR